MFTHSHKMAWKTYVYIINNKMSPKYEYLITKDSWSSFIYAKNMDKRFPLGEIAIKNSSYKQEYEKSFNCKL
jgi:hypothetical protein